MKTPSLLFSLPLLIGVLALQPRSTGQSVLEPTTQPGAFELSGKPGGQQTSSTSSGSTTTGGTTTAPGTTNPITEIPAAALAPCETKRLTIRGRPRDMDILTDRMYVRSNTRLGADQYLPGMRDLKATDIEASLHDVFGGGRADLIAYPTGKPRVEKNKVLITRRMWVKLAEGVTFSVFAKKSGAILAARPFYAEEALVLEYVTALDALEAVDRLRTMPGVLDTQIIIATRHMPEFLPPVTYLNPVGPEYNPFPLTDNVDGWVSPPFLTVMRGTAAYQWWVNNLGIPAPPPLFPIPTELDGTILGGGPVNGVPLRVDLGDFPPIRYNNATTPKFQGELSDMRVPLAWENTGDFDAPVSGNGRHVMLIDDGIQKSHLDLLNAVETNTLRHWNYFNETANPEPLSNNDFHGTALACIVGARIKTTGSRIVGVAPKCWLQGIVALKDFVDDFQWADAFAFAPPPASGPNGGPPEGNNRGTLKDTDRDAEYLDEERTGTVFFEVCLNAQGNLGTTDADDMQTEDWLWKRAIRFSATKGSAFRGIPFVTSAGNGGDGHMNLNYMELKNCIYQIPVGAVSEMGRRLAYSNTGACIVCVGPSWGDELPPYLNWPSAPGGWPNNRPVRKDPPITPDDLPPRWRRITQGIVSGTTGNAIEFNYAGTSYPAAMVAGVCALMLEVNPRLQARDIKEILLRSSRVCGDIRVDRGVSLSLADDDVLKDGSINVPIGGQNYVVKTGQMWRMSPMGHPMHHVFGAGLLDADKAVKIARKWVPLPVNPLPPIKKDVTSPTFGQNVASRNTETGGLYFPVMTSQLIPTDGRAIDIIVPSPPAGMRVEHIEVRVQAYHKRRGDLEITLIAPGPAGWEEGRELESELFVPHREDYNEDRWSTTVPELRDPLDWTFTTVRHWGTLVSAATGGIWKVRIRDAVTQGPNPSSSPEDPVVVPPSATNPTDTQSQRIAGVGITYHGIYDKAIKNSAPVVSTENLRFEPGTLPRTAQLQVEELGRDPTTHEIIWPVTSWDFWSDTVTRADGIVVPTYIPMQPTAPPVDFFEFFPPQARDAVDPNVHVPISSLGLPWPRQPFAPLWVSFVLDPAARPATWPAPPTNGAVGALTQRPRWVELTVDELWLGARDVNNSNQNTNYIVMRLNRATGVLEVIPLNKGRYKIKLYAENYLGLSKPKEIEIIVTPPGYEAWADGWWDPPDLFTPAWQGPVSGWLADPDGDGIMNGLEYALRLNPLLPDPGPIPGYRIEGDEVVFSWTQDQTATDATVHAQISEDMQAWADVAPTLVGGANGLADYEYRLPLVGDPRLFFRLWSDYNKNAGNP